MCGWFEMQPDGSIVKRINVPVRCYKDIEAAKSTCIPYLKSTLGWKGQKIYEHESGQMSYYKGYDQFVFCEIVKRCLL